MIYLRVVPLFLGIAVVLSTAGPALADSGMNGRWDSNSLRDNRIGYFLTMSPSGTSDSLYSGVMRFEYRDGRKGPRMPFTATVDGNQVTMRAKQGRFDRGSGVLRGEMSRDGVTLTLTNCQERLRLVMARALDSDCVFTLDR